MMTTIQNENTLIYQLLTSPSYRWVRHLFLILIVLIISYQLAFMSFEYRQGIKSFFFIPFLCYFILYIAAGYLNLYILIPRYFIVRNFIAYFILYTILITLVPALLFYMEYYVVKQLGLSPSTGSYFEENNTIWLTFICEIIVLGILVAGTSVTVVLKYWLLENQQLNYLKNRKIEMEVQQLKEQISPGFLFRILHSMGNEADKDAHRASAMVLHLSRLLRYQLYDGSRTQVLLKSEIQYMNTYLVLEQYENKSFQFTFRVEGEIDHILIPPLLFLPLLQQAVNIWKKENDGTPFILSFLVKENDLSFCCSGLNWSFMSPDLQENLLKRIRIVYPGRYRVLDHFLRIQI